MVSHVQTALQESITASTVVERTHQLQRGRLLKATNAAQKELVGLQNAIRTIDNDLTM